EHVLLRDLASQLAEATTQGEIVGAAAALSTLFHAHLEKENDLLLPALAEAGTDLASLLAGMHEILGEPESATQEHQCACGGHGGPENGQAEREDPAPSAAGELDLRALPHAERHARIFATFEGLPAGEGFTLVNDHDPKPL